MKDSWEFYVAGVKFHRLRDCIDEMKEGETISMEPEPTNKFDPCAVRLLHDSEELGRLMIGFVPSNYSPQVSAFLATADAPVCEITGVYPEKQPWNMLKVKIYDVGQEGSE